MRSIAKSQEPLSLRQYRLTPNASYGGYADTDALRISLVEEQRGLCCYCLSRIRPTRSEMKIEHWHSRVKYPAEQLYYTNLLAACRGNMGQSHIDQHCDTRKGSENISRNPAKPSEPVDQLIRFKPDGRISSPDSTFDDELNQVLNLNVAILVDNRKKVLQGFTDALVRRGQLSRREVERALSEWNGELSSDELKPFCQVVVYWLRKRLARI